MSILRRALLVALLSACKGPSAPVPSASLPPLSAAPHGATSSANRASGPHALPPSHPPIDEQAAPPEATFDPSSVIVGQLQLADKVKAKIAPGDTIFLVARQGGASGGPILAVKKMRATSWPLPFFLDGRDAMMTGTKLQGQVTLSVRVDKDGDAFTKNPGDVVGSAGPIAPPARNVVVTLDTVL